MKRRQLMAEQWKRFARNVIAKDAPEVQKREMRRAFYAGAQAILFKVIESFALETEPTVEDLQLIQDVRDELESFGRSVAEGRA